jgi:integrase
MTLGDADLVTLAQARDAHTKARALLASGTDPLDARHAAQPSSRTFAATADAYITAHKPGWSGIRTEEQWRRCLALHVLPAIGSKPVDAVVLDDVLRVLTRLWTKMPMLAGQVRNRLELILDYATARGWRSGPNPAAWRGNLKMLLPAKAAVHTITHRPALAWQDAPGVMAALAEQPGMPALCLRFLALTAVRSAEARGVRWDEIDMTSATWAIPAARTKARREHRVALSPQALDILSTLAATRPTDALVFFSRRPGSLIGDNTLNRVLRHLAGDREVCVHGWRSCFRDWAADNGQSDPAAEAALAHAPPASALVRAYQRSDLLEVRRDMMAAWGAFLARPAATLVALPQQQAA